MGWYNGYGNDWAPYVSVGERKRLATRQAAALAKKQKRQPAPVVIQGKKIATTFWGQAWCDNLTHYSDFSNRLPRGATYVRNGSVVDLVIKPRKIEAIVAGSEPYVITISITALAKPAWSKVKEDCSAEINSLLDLLAGRFSDSVMQRLTRPKDGLFPAPREIKMQCSCPDYSYCCKHIAAVMYGVGARLDREPELLFKLRDVDHQELISSAASEGNLTRELTPKDDSALTGVDLGELFGIELESGPSPSPQSAVSTSRSKRGGAARSKKGNQVSKKKHSKSAKSVVSAVIAAPLARVKRPARLQKPGKKLARPK